MRCPTFYRDLGSGKFHLIPVETASGAYWQKIRPIRHLLHGEKCRKPGDKRTDGQTDRQTRVLGRQKTIFTRFAVKKAINNVK